MLGLAMLISAQERSLFTRRREEPKTGHERVSSPTLAVSFSLCHLSTILICGPRSRAQSLATAGKSANKKGSMGALDADLRTFVVKTPGNERRPKIMLNPDVLSHAAQVATYYQAGTAKRGRFEPWQFDARGQYIYCGLHRKYYINGDFKDAVDRNEHNVPYQRKLRHEPPLD